MILFSSIIFVVLGILSMCIGVLFIAQGVSLIRDYCAFDIITLVIIFFGAVVVAMGAVSCFVGVVMFGWLF